MNLKVFGVVEPEFQPLEFLFVSFVKPVAEFPKPFTNVRTLSNSYTWIRQQQMESPARESSNRLIKVVVVEVLICLI